MQYSAPESTDVEIEDVFAFSGNVRVFMDIAPWRMLVNLEGLRLSAFGVIAVFRTSPQNEKTLPAKTIEPMFWEGETYKLQIDDDQETNLDVERVNHDTILKATLVEKRFNKAGLELAFRFLK